MSCASDDRNDIRCDDSSTLVSRIIARPLVFASLNLEVM